MLLLHGWLVGKPVDGRALPSRGFAFAKAVMRPLYIVFWQLIGYFVVQLLYNSTYCL